MQYNSSKPLFQYWDESPHDWGRLLEEKTRAQTKVIRVPVLWGVHEQVPGIRDFSKQSRFKLEKVLTLAQEHHLQIELILGFPPHPQSFPSWLEGSVVCEKVPGVLWDDSPPYFSMIDVPSPRDPKIRDSYGAFLEEVGSIVSLYIAPDGPITDIFFDLSPLEFSQSLMSAPAYLETLGGRYSDINIFNNRFHTHYKNLAAVISPSGSKIAEAKRPWVFAYDYQWCRKALVEKYFLDLQKLQMPQGFRQVLKMRSVADRSNYQVNDSLALCFESTLVQKGSDEAISPLVLGGQVNHSNAQAFQMAKVTSEICKNLKIKFSLSSQLEGSVEGQLRTHRVVVTGKYMACGESRILMEHVESGGTIFFPFGLPQLDENLESLGLVAAGIKTPVKILENEWFQVKKGSGYIYFPAKSLVFSRTQDWVLWVKNLANQLQGTHNG
jgi:hypothetical protein